MASPIRSSSSLLGGSLTKRKRDPRLDRNAWRRKRPSPGDLRFTLCLLELADASGAGSQHQRQRRSRVSLGEGREVRGVTKPAGRLYTHTARPASAHVPQGAIRTLMTCAKRRCSADKRSGERRRLLRCTRCAVLCVHTDTHGRGRRRRLGEREKRTVALLSPAMCPACGAGVRARLPGV